MRSKSRMNSTAHRNITGILLPRKVFLTSGVGKDADPLVSFEFALRDAEIEKFNLVPVSSVLPPGCEIVDKDEGLRDLTPGQIVFCVMAKITSNEEGKRIFASIGAAIPPSSSSIGYIAEHTGYGDRERAGKYVEMLATKMLETAFDVKPEKVLSKTASASVTLYTTAVAAAVFII